MITEPEGLPVKCLLTGLTGRMPFEREMPRLPGHASERPLRAAEGQLINVTAHRRLGIRRGGDSLHFLQRSHSEPPVIMREGGLSALQVIAKDRGPTPGKTQGSEAIRTVSETEDKHDLPTCPRAHPVRVNDMPMAMCFDNTTEL